MVNIQFHHQTILPIFLKMTTFGTCYEFPIKSRYCQQPELPLRLKAGNRLLTDLTVFSNYLQLWQLLYAGVGYSSPFDDWTQPSFNFSHTSTLAWKTSVIYNLLCIAVFLSYLGNIYRRPNINGINIKKIKKRKTKKGISKRERNELV